MTQPPFPLSPAPAYFNHVYWFYDGTWNPSWNNRNGVFYVGDTVEMSRITYSGDNPDADYEVRDYYGNVVSSGFSPGGPGGAGNRVTLTVAAPEGGWSPGWYRIYFTGPTFDEFFGYSCGATNFCVLRDDAHFPSMPAVAALPTNLGEAPDMIGKGVMGIGTSRLQIADAADPTSPVSSFGDNLSNCEDQAALTNTYWVDPGAPYADSARPRYSFCQFPNGGVDTVQAIGYLDFYAKTVDLDGSQIFVETSPGSVSGTKVQVWYPDAATLVETYDNNASETAAKNAINAASNYIFVVTAGGPTPQYLTKTAIGNSRREGVIDVVSTLSALGVHHYEGPSNEPNPWAAKLPHEMMLFQENVHLGDASAKAIGPCVVDLHNQHAGWEACFAAGMGNYIDEISFHAYGDFGAGEINVTRTNLQEFIDLLDSYSIDVPLWQTEAVSVNTTVGRTHQPRFATRPILVTLLLEQYGVTKERNVYWYDTSHGFWGIPNWFENGDGSLNPHAVMYRVLAEETWGKPYASALDFGTPGNQMYVGNVYTGAAGSTVAIMGQSPMPNGSVTLAIIGTEGPLTVVDGLGNATSMPLNSGGLTVDTSAGIPVYVELPAGASASVYECNAWGPTGLGASLSLSSSSALLGGVSKPILVDDEYMSAWTYPDQVGGLFTQGLPITAEISWAAPISLNRVIVWCEAGGGTLTDFDIETTVNGSDWLTAATVTKADAVSFRHGAATDNTGTVWETYWDHQWIFDVPFESRSGVTGVRVVANEAAWGADPDSQSGSDNGQTDMGFYLQEIGVFGSEAPPVRGLVSWAQLDVRKRAEFVGVVPI